jgi:hypothetical protein
MDEVWPIQIKQEYWTVYRIEQKGRGGGASVPGTTGNGPRLGYHADAVQVFPKPWTLVSYYFFIILIRAGQSHSLVSS